MVQGRTSALQEEPFWRPLFLRAYHPPRGRVSHYILSMLCGEIPVIICKRCGTLTPRRRREMFDSPTMVSRSSVACFSCVWDALIMEIVPVKVWHTPLLPSSFPLSFLSSSVMLMLQFKADVMPCSWAKSLPVEASSKENCFMKASRASERTKSTKQIKPHSKSFTDYFTKNIIPPTLCN